MTLQQKTRRKTAHLHVTNEGENTDNMREILKLREDEVFLRNHPWLWYIFLVSLAFTVGEIARDFELWYFDQVPVIIQKYIYAMLLAAGMCFVQKLRKKRKGVTH